MALKFRRGTTAQQSGSLAFGEPYVNTTLGTLVIGGASGDIVLSTAGTGSTGNFGPISGSGLDITGNANIAGNLTLGGNITIGDATSDTLSVTANLSSSLIPQTTNVFDIGSSAKIYRTIYGGIISGSALEIMSGSNPEVRLINKTTGIEYHIQNGDAGNFQIHNGATGNLLFKFLSGSIADGNQDAFFYGNLWVSKSISSPTITGLNTFTGSASSRLTNLESATASLFIDTNNLEAFSASQLVKDSTLQTYTASIDTKFTTLASYTASLETKNSTLATYTTSVDSKILRIQESTASLNSYTSSNDTTNTNQNTRLTRLEEATSSLNSLTGSYAKTNSANTFTGNQIVSGSMTVTQDLVVLGSSSIQNITSSNLVIGAAYVTLNANSPSSRYAGLRIIDSGSAGSSGSLLYDAVDDEFIFVHKGNGTNVTSSHIVMGPETYDNLGNETYMTTNRIPKVLNYEHIGDSNISDTGTLITLGSNTVVTGTIVASGTSLVSASAQINYTQLSGISANIISASTDSSNVDFIVSGGSITANLYGGVVSGSLQVDHNATTNYVANKHIDHTAVSITAGNGLTGGGDISATRTLTLDTTSATFTTGVKSKLDTDGVISGSKTITIGSTAITLGGSATTIAGLTSVTSTGFTGALTGNASTATTLQTARTINGTSFDGSANITIANLVSGSSQLANTSITNAQLVNSTISGVSLGSNLNTLTIGTGLSGTSYNGSAAVTIANTGVLSITTNTGLSTNASATGNVTITNTGVTSITGTSNQVVASASTGGVTLSLPQSIATSSNVQFNSLGIGGAASGTAGRIDAWGDVVAYSSSDKNFKENITPIPNALEKISKISGNTYDWKAELKDVHGYEGNDVGVIAQEIEEVLPQIVTTRDNGYKAVKYEKLVALLIEGIKEQQQQIHSLTIEVQELKKQKGL